MSVHTFPSNWKLPFNLAIGLHLVVILCALVLPQFLHQRPILPEVTTIDLVSMGEPAAVKEPAAPPAAKPAAKTAAKPATKEETAPPPPPEPPAPPKPAEIIKPEVIKQIPPPIEKPIPVPEPVVTPEPAAPPAPAEAISLKPLKQKIKKEVKEIPDKKIEETKARKDELKTIAQQLQEEAKKDAAAQAQAQETIKKQRQLAAAREQARQADLEARLAMAEAERAAAEARNARQNQQRAGSSQSASSGNSGNTQTMGVLEQQYYATIMGHVKQYWQPPDVKSWDPNLLAIVSITIAANGQIVSQAFEKESGDKLFDQFVLKTLEAANPLPAPPPALQKQRLEIGLRFKPSGIQ
jgi:TolA protein